MRLREIKNLPKITQLIIQIRAVPKYFSGSNTYNFQILPPLRAGKTLVRSVGRWLRLGKHNAYLLSFHITFLPCVPHSTSYCNSLKYLRTISSLKGPGSLQRELIQTQINKFHLKWEDTVRGTMYHMKLTHPSQLH